MPADLFGQAGSRRLRQIEEAQRDKVTGFFMPDHRWEEPVYLLDGATVTKEEFILRSGVEHLLPGASSVKCSSCGRQVPPPHWHESCDLPQPDGSRCKGVF
ncbi:hypothetical protein PQR75_40710 [Paraburkholderia fungorum]|uniref:zinc finger domain-containing protein n=1 Tax=Paraburkholderia fungorum TaxID=134537 RepID=UPI0038BA5435